MLTLAQIRAAYGLAVKNGDVFQTFAIRDYFLYLIYENTFSSSSGGGQTETLTSETWNNASIDTTIEAGATCVTFETSEDFSGSINGITRQPSRSYTFRANHNNTLSAIVVVVNNGTINADSQRIV